MSGRPHGAAWTASLLLLFPGCDEAPLARGLEVYLRTDMPIADVSVIAAESLDASGHVHETEWYEVREGCAPAADATQTLGSFGVRPGSSSVAHLRLRAYRRSERNELVPTVERSADATFTEGTEVLGLLLGSACAHRPRCGDGYTCDPRDGQCRPIQAIPAEGELAPGGSCLSSVGNTAPGMVYGNIPCSTADCTSECARCDLPATPGECTHFDYASIAAPLTDANYQALCASDRVRVVCHEGVCASDCEQGYGNCDGLPLGEGGCESTLFTKEHCRNCDELCRYGFCSKQDGCVAHRSGTADPALATTSGTLEPSKLYATLVPIDLGDRKLRALGALIDAKVASRGIQLALYYQRGTSFDLVYGAMAVDSVDAMSTVVAARDDVVRVEVQLPDPGIALPPNTPFLIAAQVPMRTQLKSEPGELSWVSADAAYGELPLQFPPDYKSLMGPKLALYTVTTPE